VKASFERVKTKARRIVSMSLARRVVHMRNAAPLITFTFDDFPRSALREGGAILEGHGVSGTFFASFGLMGRNGPAGEMFRPDDVGYALERNHELGCHTYDHSHAWNTPARQFEASILRNREALQKQVPGALFKTLSYPSSCPRPETKQRISKYFDCCRGGGQALNVDSLDLNFVTSYFLEQMKDDFELVSSLIEANRRARGWLLFSTHDISERPSRFGCTPNFFEEVLRRAVRSGATIVTVSEGLNRIYNTNAAYAPASQDVSQTSRLHVSSML
jgi:peptidoglycan/xylan/chitin deacetylase (PgdA/CDA1 family)